MAQRVVDIVSKQPAGYWGEGLLKIYSDDYDESLPEDWVKRVQSVTDELAFIAVQENFLVCKALPKTSETTPVMTERPNMHFDESVSDLLVQPASRMMESRKHLPSMSDEPIRPVAPQYTDSSIWLVHVLVVCAGDQVKGKG